MPLGAPFAYPKLKEVLLFLPASVTVPLDYPTPSLHMFSFYALLKTGSVQFSSVTQSCPTLCDPMNRSMPGLPVHHQLLELTQTHAHRVGDAIQPSHPLSSPSPPENWYFSMKPSLDWHVSQSLPSLHLSVCHRACHFYLLCGYVHMSIKKSSTLQTGGHVFILCFIKAELEDSYQMNSLCAWRVDTMPPV